MMKAVYSMDDGYIELNREFLEVSKEDEPDLAESRYWREYHGGGYGWPDLLERRRVVLLAEASSGKTEEFRHHARELQAKGQAAFFVPIETLADEGFDNALEHGDAEQFTNWKQGYQAGYFFLDSVDEARLINRSYFVRALKKLSRELGDGLQRAHIYVSCRVSDWKGESDRRTMQNILPIPTKSEVVPEPLEDPDHPLLAPIFSKKSEKYDPLDEKEAGEPDEMIVVRLIALDDKQWKTFAKAKGVNNSDEFVKAIEQNGLEPLADRPGDLLDLVAYWRQHGRFGTRREMFEYGVTHRIAERETDRPDNNLPADDKAQEGAERIAASLTLGKSFVIRALGVPQDPDLDSRAIDPKLILPEWTDAERDALLRRGIFAPAIYGRIRFHHRSTQEYLTATWFARLIDSGCPKKEIFDLLFPIKYGVDTVVPSLKPVIVWLALDYDDIRQELIRREPLVLLRYGDPGSLKLDDKKQLLRTYADKYKQGQYRSSHAENVGLWMFTDPALADTIREVWVKNDKHYFLWDLLGLIEQGRISACLDLVQETALDEDNDAYLRFMAVRALKALDDPNTLSAVAESVFGGSNKMKLSIAGGFAEELFPDHLSVPQLLEFIDNSMPEKGDSDWSLSSTIEKLWHKCPISGRSELIAGFADFCLLSPFEHDYRRISKRHKNLARWLGPIALDIVKHHKDEEPETGVVRLLMVVERSEQNGLSNRKEPSLSELVQSKPKLNRALFWADIDEQRQYRDDDNLPTRWWHAEIYLESQLWEFSMTDLNWLYQDLKIRTLVDDRRIALSAIYSIQNGDDALDEAEIKRLRNIIQDDEALNTDLDGYLVPTKEDEKIKEVNAKRRAKRELRQKKEKLEEKEAKESWKRFRNELAAEKDWGSDQAAVSSGPLLNHLFNLTKWLKGKTGLREIQAAKQWGLLEEGFDGRTAENYRDGMKLLWRHTKPRRPKHREGGHITTKWTTILSFAALALEAADNPDWASILSPDEAELAARHCCMAEEGYPEWLNDLLAIRPDAVLPVIKKELKAEWKSEINGSSSYLYHFARPENSIAPPLKDILFNLITRSKPPGHLRHLEYGIRILGRMDLGKNEQKRLERAATKHLDKIDAKKELQLACHYLAMLFLVDPEAATQRLEQLLAGQQTKKKASIATEAFPTLFSRDDPIALSGLNEASAELMERLVLLAFKHIRPKDDIVHEGAYSPGARDNAERARDMLLGTLQGKTGIMAYEAVLRLAQNKKSGINGGWLKEKAFGMAERDTEIPAWTEKETVGFEQSYTAPVKTGEDLFRVAQAVLGNIKHDFAHEDATSKSLVFLAPDEKPIQKWLAEQFRQRNRERYHTHREVEVADKKEPDIVLSSTTAQCEVAIEVKHGGMDWSVRDFEHALGTQLAEQYLRPENRRHGILVITHHGKRTWRHPETKKKMLFNDVIEHLGTKARTIRKNTAGLIEVLVVGIDAASVDNKVAELSDQLTPAELAHSVFR